MVISAGQVQMGMVVYGSDGETIGKVGEITNLPIEGQPYKGREVPDHLFFLVDQGGILGIGSTKLYVPFRVIQKLDPFESVTLSCSKDEADRRYKNKPSLPEAESS
ncbi:MAG: DUF2171 domain-containing protein [Chloroflexi bacterium]|nr:DUF2171 domain-containing protein [Chloroflexota bacterium]